MNIRFRPWRLLCSGAALLLAASAQPRPKLGVPIFGPYKHLAMALNPDQPVARTLVNGQLRTLTAPEQAADVLVPGATLTLAFASGECGNERWAALDANAVAEANVAALHRARIPYIIATGGEGQVFTCSTDEGMERFLARYLSPSLVGFDFDIESTQSAKQIQALIQRIAVAQQRHPALRWSFTLATFAASDGSHASLNSTGEQVLAALRLHGVHGAIINLMVMNYGPSHRSACVLAAQGHCDMAASARQAVQNLQLRHGIPLQRIAITAMIGLNDVTENVLTLADARALARYAQTAGLAGLHFWSLDRDTPCAQNQATVLPTCHGVTDAALAFSRALSIPTPP